jgi:hypothetical protein
LALRHPKFVLGLETIADPLEFILYVEFWGTSHFFQAKTKACGFIEWW